MQNQNRGKTKSKNSQIEHIFSSQVVSSQIIKKGYQDFEKFKVQRRFIIYESIEYDNGPKNTRSSSPPLPPPNTKFNLNLFDHVLMRKLQDIFPRQTLITQKLSAFNVTITSIMSLLLQFYNHEYYALDLLLLVYVKNFIK